MQTIYLMKVRRKDISFIAFMKTKPFEIYLGDSDDESEPFEGFNVTSKCWTILKTTG